MLSDVIVSFDLHQLLGADYNADRRTVAKAYVVTNVVNGTLMDVSTGETRLGDQAVTIGTDGTGSWTTWAPGADGNPISWQETLVLDYPRLGQRDRAQRRFGPFTIVGTVKTVTNKALTSNVATLTFDEAHGLDFGNAITITGVDATFNGVYTVSGTPTSTTLTYARTASDVASVASGGTLTSPNIKLAFLEEEQAVPAEYITEVTAYLDGIVDAGVITLTDVVTTGSATLTGIVDDGSTALTGIIDDGTDTLDGIVADGVATINATTAAGEVLLQGYVDDASDEADRAEDAADAAVLISGISSSDGAIAALVGNVADAGPLTSAAVYASAEKRIRGADLLARMGGKIVAYDNFKRLDQVSLDDLAHLTPIGQIRWSPTRSDDLHPIIDNQYAPIITASEAAYARCPVPGGHDAVGGTFRTIRNGSTRGQNAVVGSCRETFGGTGDGGSDQLTVFDEPISYVTRIRIHQAAAVGVTLAQLTVTNKALTSNVATLTTSAAHGLVVGSHIVVSGVDATFNGTFTVTAVPTTTTVSYAKTAADVAATAASGFIGKDIVFPAQMIQWLGFAPVDPVVAEIDPYDTIWHDLETWLAGPRSLLDPPRGSFGLFDDDFDLAENTDHVLIMRKVDENTLGVETPDHQVHTYYSPADAAKWGDSADTFMAVIQTRKAADTDGTMVWTSFAASISSAVAADYLPKQWGAGQALHFPGVADGYISAPGVDQSAADVVRYVALIAPDVTDAGGVIASQVTAADDILSIKQDATTTGCIRYEPDSRTATSDPIPYGNGQWYWLEIIHDTTASTGAITFSTAPYATGVFVEPTGGGWTLLSTEDTTSGALEAGADVPVKLGDLKPSAPNPYAGSVAIFRMYSDDVLVREFDSASKAFTGRDPLGGQWTFTETAVAWRDVAFPPSHTFVGVTDAQTLTNKRVTPRTSTQASSTTPTINTDLVEFHSVTALGGNITSMTTNLSGTPTTNQRLALSITDNGTSRTITWGASFENGPASLPGSTETPKRLDTVFWWNSVTSKWRCMASGSG